MRDLIIKYMCDIVDKYDSLELRAAMLHSIHGGGLIRGLLLANLARHPDACRVAASLECMHVYTLIHDDLPIFDNDDMRRGRPACHIAFDERTAVLAGNALVTLSIEYLCGINSIDVNKRLAIIAELSRAFSVVMAGQHLDCNLGNVKDAADVQKMISMKTSQPFVAACVCACILNDNRPIIQLKIYGENLGIAYQIADDIEDYNKSEANTVKLIGVNAAKDLAYSAIEIARCSVAELSDQDFLLELLDMVRGKIDAVVL